MPDLTGAVWRKSTRSNAGGNCVEVADNLPGVVVLRDSKNPSGLALTFAPSTWATFVTRIKAERRAVVDHRHASGTGQGLSGQE